MTTVSEIHRIEERLARTRLRMAGHLGQLQRHLEPRQMLNDTMIGIRGRHGAEFTSDLIARMKANPTAAAFAGLAITWLMVSKGAATPARSRPVIVVEGPLPHIGDQMGETLTVAPTTSSAANRQLSLTTGPYPMARPTNGTFSKVAGNPFALGTAAALVGIIAGALFPTSRKEEEALGSVATKLRVAGRDLAQDVVDRGGRVVEDTLETAKAGADAHGLNAAKPIGELFADARSGALAQDVKQIAQEALQAETPDWRQ